MKRTLSLLFFGLFIAMSHGYAWPLPPTTVATYVAGDYLPGQTILFDGSGSHDNDYENGGYTPQWLWDFNYSGNFAADTKVTTASPTITHAFNALGTYTVAVEYIDDDNQAGNIVTLTVTIVAYARYYYLKDHLGDIKMIVKASGAVDSWNDYYPFGMQMDSRNGSSSADARYKYASKERDVETGYDDFDARYYDARIGRFLSPDPLFDNSELCSWSPYHYSYDNPIRFIDPTGLTVGDSDPEAMDSQADLEGTASKNMGNGAAQIREGASTVLSSVKIQSTIGAEVGFNAKGGDAAGLSLKAGSGGVTTSVDGNGKTEVTTAGPSANVELKFAGQTASVGQDGGGTKNAKINTSGDVVVSAAIPATVPGTLVSVGSAGVEVNITTLWHGSAEIFKGAITAGEGIGQQMLAGVKNGIQRILYGEKPK